MYNWRDDYYENDNYVEDEYASSCYQWIDDKNEKNFNLLEYKSIVDDV